MWVQIMFINPYLFNREGFESFERLIIKQRSFK